MTWQFGCRKFIIWLTFFSARAEKLQKTTSPQTEYFIEYTLRIFYWNGKNCSISVQNLAEKSIFLKLIHFYTRYEYEVRQFKWLDPAISPNFLSNFDCLYGSILFVGNKCDNWNTCKASFPSSKNIPLNILYEIICLRGSFLRSV